MSLSLLVGTTVSRVIWDGHRSLNSLHAWLLFFSKSTFPKTEVTNDLDPDQVRPLLGLTWVQTAWKDYQ